MSSNLVLLNGPMVEPQTWRFVQLCEDLHSYVWNNHDAMIGYSRRWREGKPIPRSDAASPPIQDMTPKCANVESGILLRTD